MRSPLFAASLALSLLAPAIGTRAADTAAAHAEPAIQVGIDLAADGPLFTYITGKPYKITIKIENKGKDEVKIDKIDVTCKAAKDAAIDVKSEVGAPATVATGASASATYNVVFPDQAAGQQVSLTANVQCGDTSKKAEAVVAVSPPFEITLLPSRLILDSAGGPKNVGMSIINHTEAPFEGKVKFTCYPGIEVNPTEVDAKIDPLGLEAFVLSVWPVASPAPGHYAVFVDVGGKAKDWVAVDVPVILKKGPGPKFIDRSSKEAKPSDEMVPSVDLTRIEKTGDGNTKYVSIGKCWISYSDWEFVASLVLNDGTHVPAKNDVAILDADSVQIAFDPLLDGAKSPSGGYRDDDVEIALSEARLVRTKRSSSAPRDGGESDVRFLRENNKSYYEVHIPWAELLPFKPEKGKMFAISILVNDSDGSKITQYEFGGGIAGNGDPRRFVPVVLD
ncbi:MAG: hypothetical protein M1133_01775 [Armatimonadetes bacterium]|nr:hypothetical protein [Armatimonadota bacterium]